MSQPSDLTGYTSSRGKPRAQLYRPARDDADRSRGRGGNKYFGGGGRHQQRQGDVQSAAPPTILLKTRTQEPSQARSLSPAQQQKEPEPFKVPATKKEVTGGMQQSSSTATAAATAMTLPVKILDENLTFQDSLHEFLSENSDYLVVGCVGLQWSGKSTVLSHLAVSNCSDFVKQSVFSVTTPQVMMKASSATIGIDAWIENSERIIWLDCQSLLSAAVAERELANNSKTDSLSATASSCIGTLIEVQSLQLLSFLYCICHVVVVVQDSLADPVIIRLLQTAEMLKPNVDESTDERMPHLVCVYNRAQPSDLVPKVLKETNHFYRLAFKKSRLQTGSSGHHSAEEKSNNSGGGDVYFTPLTDWNCSVGGNGTSLIEPHDGDQWVSYSEAIPRLKRTILALPRHVLFSSASGGQTEKSWFSMASRSWEAVRKSTLMNEYARLLQ